MLLALHVADYGVLALYLIILVVIGLRFSRDQQTSKDFFLAGRSMSALPVGLSIMATLLSALSYTGVPGEAYYEGFKFLLMPLAIWLCLPLLSNVFIPLYRNLGLYSVYEYLELRYDLPTRIVSSMVFIFWRLLWLGGVLYAPCKVWVVASGVDLPLWSVLLTLGLIGTLYTFLGGMKAVIWTDVLQSLVMVAGLVMIIGCVWWKLEGGPLRVWEVAAALGRTEAIDASFDWSAKWPIWGILPHFILAMLSFYIADQITAQRYLTARDLPEARRSFTMNCISVTVMVPALMYVGVALLAFYHDNPQALRPLWVLNVDGVTRDHVNAPDALVPWQQEDLEPQALRDLVAQERILHPNSKRPIENADSLLRGADEGASIDVNALAMRRTPSGGLVRGEVILHRRAKDELMPRFIARHLPWGAAGVILAALFAASMSSMDSGLNAIGTLVIMEGHRRLGWGRKWLARRVGKAESDLDEADELKLGRPLVLILGVAATLFSFAVAQVNDIFDIMVKVVNTFGGPLLSIFLLGAFTRRTTAAGALIALVGGTLFTLWLTLSNSYDLLRPLWPFAQPLNGIWPLTLGVGFTLLLGYGVSLFVGRRPSPDELRGLVVGLGRLGRREPEEASIAIPDELD